MVPMNNQQLLAHDPRLEFDVADRMRRALRISGLGVQDIAETIEVSRNTVSNWINGHTAVKDRDLKQFALTTGVPFEWLKYGYVTTHHHPDGETLQNIEEITNRYLSSPPNQGTGRPSPLWGVIDEPTAEPVAA